MSEFGTIIDPYRVAPSGGGVLEGLAQMAMGQEQVAKMKQDAMLAQATRQYLAQQMGLPEGADPMAVQNFRGEGQRQQIAGSNESRVAQDHQGKLDYAQKFLGALPQQGDPTLAAMQAGGGVFGASALTDVLGRRFGQQEEMQNRVDMNKADNVAAQQRLDAQMRAQAAEAVAAETRKTGSETAEQTKLQAAVVKAQMDGDWSQVYSMAPNLMGSPVQLDREESSRGRVDARAKQVADEKQATDDMKLKQSPVGEIQTKTDPRVKQSRVETSFPNMTPEQMVQQVVQGANSFGGDSRYKMVKEMFPELYDRIWNAEQQKLKEAAVYDTIKASQNNNPQFKNYPPYR